MNGDRSMPEAEKLTEDIFSDLLDEDEEDYNITDFLDTRKFLVESSASKWLIANLV